MKVNFTNESQPKEKENSIEMVERSMTNFGK
jgi:hypothetical protein